MSEASIPFDSVLDSCQNHHRRIVLKMLAKEQRSITLDDLTKVVFKHNHQTPVIEAPVDELTDIRISLYQIHLPKLAAEGLIDYDPDNELVEPTEKLEHAQPTLSTILGADPSLNVTI